MSRKALWTSFGAALSLFALVAFGPGAPQARASSGCYSPGESGTVCGMVQVCDLGGCFYWVYRESPPCRPSGAGPACDEE